jgi:hypothetical protein
MRPRQGSRRSAAVDGHVKQSGAARLNGLWIRFDETSKWAAPHTRPRPERIADIRRRWRAEGRGSLDGVSGLSGPLDFGIIRRAHVLSMYQPADKPRKR